MPTIEAIPPAIRRAACAFHEAGHIVVGWHYRRAITHAWLRPPQGVSGETCFEPYRRGFQLDRAGDLRRAEIEITILSAGQCGEMVYWNGAEGLKWYPGELRSHGDDLDQMQPFIALLQPDGLRVFLAVLAKSTLSLAAVVLLGATTPFSEVLRALSRFRVPPLLVTVLALLYRYLSVLVEEMGRMQRARRSRTFSRSRWITWRSSATVVGQLFLRTTTRAERIYAAMCARGWRT